MREINGPIEKKKKKENYKGTNLEDYMQAIITNEEQVYDALRPIKKNLSEYSKIGNQKCKSSSIIRRTRN